MTAGRTAPALFELLATLRAAPVADRRNYAAMLTQEGARVADTRPMRSPDGEWISGAAWSVAIYVRLAALLDASCDDDEARHVAT